MKPIRSTTQAEQAEPQFSPLDQIRLAEAEATRKIAAARQAADLAVKEARMQADTLRRQACETGRVEGEVRRKEWIREAEAEAEAIQAAASGAAEELLTRGEVCLEAAVRHAVALVAGLELEQQA
ncbi:MAG: hypothetical protein AB1449_12500 [Chloroflexota bacterium]